MRARLGLGLLVLLSAFGLAACGGDGGGGGSSGMAGSDGGGSGGSGGSGQCTSTSCDDGVYCNGDETCDPTNADADGDGCVAGTPVDCDDNLSCTTDSCDETAQACVHAAPDLDTDDHGDAACVDANGDPIGDDCADDDADRYPGNAETCDAVDNDCNPLTIGYKDDDGDGSIDDTCCNTDSAGTERCGGDCNDSVSGNGIAQREGQPEFCDDVDNDCDGTPDNGTLVEIPWYVDADGDGFGSAIDASPTMSCEPIPNASLLNTDCDDTQASRHPAQLDICDAVDNNCNGILDENATGDCTTDPPDGTPLPIDECLNGLDTCADTDICLDEPAGFTCLNLNDPCDRNGTPPSNNGGCDMNPLATCTPTTDGRTCACPNGSRGTGIGQNGCILDGPDPCATNNGGCPAVYTTCVVVGGGTVSCMDINECSTSNGGCASVATCTNNDSVAQTCMCPAYYSGNGMTCMDINECLTSNGGCASVATCTNNTGAAPTCVCPPTYYTGDGIGTNGCADVNECTNSNGSCGDPTYFSCVNNVGAPPTCGDINECASSNGGCASVATCTNNSGAPPTCSCPAYYTGDGTTCTDIDECATNNGGCGNPLYATCADNDGAPPTCSAVDECLTNNGGCGDSTYYTCDDSNPDAAPLCGAIDQCAVNNGGCADTCINVPGQPAVCVVEKICAGDRNVNSSTALAALVAEACTRITGNLTVGNSATVTTLAGLETIRRIDGSVNFYYASSLTSLAGLNGLITIGGNLYFTSTATNLTNVALTGLRTVGGYVTISGVPMITNLAGLSGLISVGGNFTIGTTGNNILSTTANLTSLTKIGGTLSVSGNPLLSILSFPALKEVGGLTIGSGNTSLSTLGNFTALREIKGAVSISTCPSATPCPAALTNVNALNALSSITGSVTIAFNPELANLTSISSTRISGNLLIHSNPKLTSISGFGSMSSTGAGVEIYNNALLLNISGFAGLGAIETYLSIHDNPTMTQITGFGALSTVGGEIRIMHNPAMTQFNSIDSLTRIGDDLRVEGNLVLNSIAGLRASPIVALGNRLMIRLNPALSTCEVKAMVAKLASADWPDEDLSCCNNGCTTCGVSMCNAGPGGLAGQSSTVYEGNGDNTVNDFTATATARLGVLANTTEIEDSLTIQNTTVTNLSGLGNLTLIGGNLTIQGNTSLGNLTGLNALTSIGRNVWIDTNAALMSISALSALTTVVGYFHFYNNDTVSSLAGLSALTTIGGYLNIDGNQTLGNVNALSALTSIGATAVSGQGYLRVYNNPTLTSLSGITSTLTGNLTRLAGNLTIQYNAALTTCAATALRDALLADAMPAWTGTLSNVSNLACTTPLACGGTGGATCQ